MPEGFGMAKPNGLPQGLKPRLRRQPTMYGLKPVPSKLERSRVSPERSPGCGAHPRLPIPSFPSEKNEKRTCMSTKHEVAVELAGGKRLVFETGRMAKQASGAALVSTGETVVLATAVASSEPREGIDFFPLTVDYREYTYAGGRIPG